ncbi:MAG: response regulator [Cyanobacteria bacterium J06621_12]
MQSLTLLNRSKDNQPIVLVAEDDEDNLLYISSAFDLFGYHCISTQDPSVCLSLVQIYQPDLIILDVKLPDLTGVNLVRQLKFDPTTRKIPVIAATTMARAEEKEFILDAGFDNYLLKPFFLENLEQMVCSYLTQQFATAGKITA